MSEKEKSAENKNEEKPQSGGYDVYDHNGEPKYSGTIPSRSGRSSIAGSRARDPFANTRLWR